MEQSIEESRVPISYLDLFFISLRMDIVVDNIAVREFEMEN